MENYRRINRNKNYNLVLQARERNKEGDDTYEQLTIH